MDVALVEVTTPPSPPSPLTDSSENKKRKRKKTGSREKPSAGKDKKDKIDKTISKGVSRNDAMNSMERHSSPKDRDDVDRTVRDVGKDSQDFESIITESIRGSEKPSNLPPSPSSPADSVFDESPFPTKRQHSKSRSRSGSRSRFSGLFKKKKQRSQSETDVRQEALDVEGDNSTRGSEGAAQKERNRRAKSASSNRHAGAIDAVEAGTVAGSGTFPRKGNLKRESPYHAYDSRVQPRDRLLNMTVKDAAKEHMLRKVDSGGISPMKSKQGEMGLGQGDVNYGRYIGDATYPLYSEQPSISSLPLTGATTALVHNTMGPNPEVSMRSSTLPRTLRSKSSTVAPFGCGQSGIEGRSDPSDVITSSTLPRNASTPAFVHSPTGLSKDQLNVSQEIKMLGQNQTDDLANSPLFSAQNVRSDEDKSRTSGSTGASRILDPKGNRKEEASSEAARYDDNETDASSKRLKRKTSLSKFLELRQTQPSGLALTRRTSQSSDSGVTSRDTSPGTSVIRRHTRKEQESNNRGIHTENVSPVSVSTSGPQRTRASYSGPSTGFKRERLRSNPYVLSSVVIPDSNVLPAPRLYLNGTHLEASDPAQLQSPVSQPSARDTDDGSIDSFSMCPSPNMEASQTSSYRSSDQGFVESETSDADVEDIFDDNSDFSTPPEEVEPLSPLEANQESSMRFATPRVLEKLLTDTQRQIYQNRRLFGRENEEKSVLSTQDTNRDSQSPDRYVPHGVRRSHSNRENTKRPTSPRRTFRQGPSFSDSSKEATTLSESLETLKELPSSAHVDAVRVLSPSTAYDKRALDEDRLSAASTSTLTNLDSVGFVSGGPVSDPQQGQDRTSPRLSVTAQEKYRRTFSPARKVLVPTPEEDLTGPYNSSHLANLPLSSASSSVSQTFVKPIFNDESEMPTHIPSPRPPYSSQSVPPPPKSTVSGYQENSGKGRRIDQDCMFKIDRQLDSVAICSESDQCKMSERSPSADRLLGSGAQQASVKAFTIMLGRGVSLPAGKPDTLTFAASNNDCTNTESSMQQLQHARSDELCKNVMSDMGTVPATRPNALHPNFTGSTTPSFPMIHGLELAAHKEPSFKGGTLSEFLQEQSRIKCQGQGPANKVKIESPTKKLTKKEMKKEKKQKKQKAEEKKRQIDTAEEDGGQKSPVIETHAVLDSVNVSPEKSPVSSLRVDGHESGMRIMVDKECQTSTWLLNSIRKTKLKKSKKKSQSFTKTKSTRRRRDSAASDTYIPASVSLQRRGATQWSSLGDVRVVAAYEDRQRSVSPEKKLKRSKSDRASKRSAEEEFQVDSSNHGRGRTHSDDIELPKPKKLSLTAIILLKNRLAKYRERKSKEREASEGHPEEDDQVESDVPSDTLVTIENEINLSKLEVSKETDIVDDDIFEPEFSLDYSKRQLRFEDMPPSEPMQSEEPLPPLPPQASRRMRHRRESTMRERRRKCVSYCKKFIAFLFSHIGLCSLVVAYTIMGGFMFQFIESDKDMDVGKTVNVSSYLLFARFIIL